MNMFCPSSKSNSTHESNEPNASKEPPKELKYRLLMKKGSKQTAFVMIPAESPLVANRDKVAEWKEERQDIKRKVLEYEEREEDEAMMNSFGSIPYPITRGKDISRLNQKNKKLFRVNPNTRS